MAKYKTKPLPVTGQGIGSGKTQGSLLKASRMRLMQSASRTAALEPQQEQGMHENGSGLWWNLLWSACVLS